MKLKSDLQTDPQRRAFLNGGVFLVAGACFAPWQRVMGQGMTAQKDTGMNVVGETTKPAAPSQDMSPAEHLMRQHGVLDRLLLIYDGQRAQIAAGKAPNAEAASAAAGIVRHFVEDYHQKLEEDLLFPRIKLNSNLSALVDVLHAQHDAARHLTDSIMADLQTPLREATDKQRLARRMQMYCDMYRPHEAREATLLYPALRRTISKSDYDVLTAEIEKREREMFGEDGFATVVAQVADLERKIGTFDLAQFTPQLEKM